MKTIPEIETFVADCLPEYELLGQPASLAGGLINQTWRIRARPDPIIVKHAPPFIATAPEIPFKPVRILFEARCLELLGTNGTFSFISNDRCRPPRLLAQDMERHLIAMEFIAPSRPLHTWLMESDADAGNAGRELGHFIGQLHGESCSRPYLALRHANLNVQETRFALLYDAIETYCRKASLSDAPALGKRARELGRRLLLPGKCLIMGDLWPHSILIADEGLRIIDWEFSHFGNPAQDIGHLAAHIWMLQHRRIEARNAIASFWHGFLSAYMPALGTVRDVLWSHSEGIDAAIHFGAEIIMRTVGSFQVGYLYEGLEIDSPFIQEAVEQAADSMRAPEDTGLYGVLCNSA